MQGELLNCAIERRKLVEMIATLTRRFPDEEVALAEQWATIRRRFTIRSPA